MGRQCALQTECKQRSQDVTSAEVEHVHEAAQVRKPIKHAIGLAVPVNHILTDIEFTADVLVLIVRLLICRPVDPGTRLLGLAQ